MKIKILIFLGVMNFINFQYSIDRFKRSYKSLSKEESKQKKIYGNEQKEKIKEIIINSFYSAVTEYKKLTNTIAVNKSCTEKEEIKLFNARNVVLTNYKLACQNLDEPTKKRFSDELQQLDLI